MKKMIGDFSFESQRLKSRPLVKEDANILLRMYADKEAMKFRGSKSLVEIEDAYAMISESFTQTQNISKLRLGIVTKEHNQLIGTALISWKKDEDQECEIGFSFGKENWGKGYGKETVTMIEDRLKMLSISSVFAWCVQGNLASIRIFRNAGYVETSQNEYPNSLLFKKNIIP